MVLGCWVGDLLPAFLIFLLLFSVVFFIPYGRIDCLGWVWEVQPLCLVPFPFLSFFSLSLALMRADPTVAGFWSLFNKYKLFNHTFWYNLDKFNIRNFHKLILMGLRMCVCVG